MEKELRNFWTKNGVLVEKKEFFLVKLPYVVHHETKEIVVFGDWAICEKIGETYYLAVMKCEETQLPMVSLSKSFLNWILQRADYFLNDCQIKRMDFCIHRQPYEFLLPN